MRLRTDTAVADDSTAMDRSRRLTVVGVGLSAAVMTLDTTVVNIALPEIRESLGSSLSALQWIVNGYALAFAALLLSAGSLSDRWGRRPMFLAGMAVFTVASLACTVAWSTETLVIARIVQGIGASLVMGAGLALITEVHEGRPAAERQKAIGAFTAFGAAAAALGPAVGAVMTTFLGWRSIFALNVVLAVVVLALVARERHPAPAGPVSPGTPVDRLGALLAVLMLLAANYAVLEGAAGSWTRPDVTACLVAAPVLLLILVLHEGRRGEAAMLDLSLLRIPTFVGAITLSFTSRVATFGLLATLVLWLTGPLALSTLSTGLLMVSQSLLMMVAAGVSSGLAQRMPVRVVVCLGMMICAAGALGSAVLVDGNGSWPTILPAVVLLGAGAGLVMPHLLGLAVGVVPPARAGMASGASNAFLPLGTAVGVAVFGAVMSARTAARLEDPALAREVAAGRMPQDAALLGAARDAFADGFSTVLLVAGVVCVLGGLLALLLVRENDRHVS